MTRQYPQKPLRPLTLQGREVALHLRSEPMERVGNLQDFEGRGFCGYIEKIGGEGEQHRAIGRATESDLLY